MIKEIYVHIGYNKTGTSSIQEMMYQNASLLLKHGIYYPTLSCNHSKFLFSMFTSNPEKKRMNINAGYTSAKQVATLNENYQKIIERELRNPAIEKVIFSGEHLISLKDEETKKFSQWLLKFSDKITIICCTRNPIEWYNSRIQQKLKERSKDIDSICRSLQKGTKLGYQSLKPYVNHFGKSNMVVYDFNTHKHHLYEKFMDSCAISESIKKEILKKPINTQNESLSHECCLILSHLNKLKPWKPSQGKPYYEPWQLYKIKGEKFQLNRESLSKILQASQADIEWVAENFKAECSSYLKWPQQLDQVQANNDLFQEKTTASLALLISDLINENKQLKNSPLLAIRKSLRIKLDSAVKKFPPLKKLAQRLIKNHRHR